MVGVGLNGMLVRCNSLVNATPTTGGRLEGVGVDDFPTWQSWLLFREARIGCKAFSTLDAQLQGGKALKPLRWLLVRLT